MTFFTFYYHLIFDSKSLKIYGFKTLIRIVEEDGTIHPAGDFIYILEKHPYIHILEEKNYKRSYGKIKKMGYSYCYKSLRNRISYRKIYRKKLLKIIKIVESTY